VITAVVPVSPIKSHPDTAILTETMDSIRSCLPDAEIILTFDGVRPENEFCRKDYDEFTRRALWLADHKYGNVLPIIFNQHEHQTGMMRQALWDITTPLLMYVEQDTPLVTDEPIDWESILHMLMSGASNVVRLHHEAVIPSDHEHLMHGSDSGFIRTSQWSQRPHIALVAYYRRIMDNHFTQNARCFIEDKMHGVLDEAYRVDGLPGWNQHRVHIYDPGNGNIKRSYHTDGRAGEPKYDDTQVF
jgi:hypothetical protein